MHADEVQAGARELVAPDARRSASPRSTRTTRAGEREAGTRGARFPSRAPAPCRGASRAPGEVGARDEREAADQAAARRARRSRPASWQRAGRPRRPIDAGPCADARRTGRGRARRGTPSGPERARPRLSSPAAAERRRTMPPRLGIHVEPHDAVVEQHAVRRAPAPAAAPGCRSRGEIEGRRAPARHSPTPPAARQRGAATASARPCSRRRGRRARGRGGQRPPGRERSHDSVLTTSSVVAARRPALVAEQRPRPPVGLDARSCACTPTARRRPAGRAALTLSAAPQVCSCQSDHVAPGPRRAAGREASGRAAHAPAAPRACSRRRALARTVASSAALETAPSSQYGVMSPAARGRRRRAGVRTRRTAARPCRCTSRGVSNARSSAHEAGSSGSTGPLSPPMV